MIAVISSLSWVLLGLVALIALIVFALIIPHLKYYTMARFSGAAIPFTKLVWMQWKKIDARRIVFSYIRSVRAGVNISVDQLIAHEVAGGRVPSVVNAMIVTHRTGIALPYEVACEIDLAGVDVQAWANDIARKRVSGPEITLDEALAELASNGGSAFPQRSDRQ